MRDVDCKRNRQIMCRGWWISDLFGFCDLIASFVAISVSSTHNKSTFYQINDVEGENMNCDLEMTSPCADKETIFRAHESWMHEIQHVMLLNKLALIV